MIGHFLRLEGVIAENIGVKAWENKGVMAWLRKIKRDGVIQIKLGVIALLQNYGVKA